jgi:hypothetical protein
VHGTWRRLLPLALLAGFVVAPLPAQAHHSTFVDTVGGAFEDDATWLAGVGVSEGCDATGTRFCPTADLTRGQLAALLVRALDLPPADVDPFDDDAGGPFDAPAASLAAAQITSGCRVDAFCPAAPITRAELAVMLVRALDLATADAPTGFDDVDGRWFAPEVAALVAEGITEGCTTTGPPAFCPDGTVTRGQAAALLQRGLGDVLVPDHDAETATAPRYDFTVGTSRSSNYEVGPVGSRDAHGNRIYCGVSHFSHDDPVVLPDQPGAAHLHMFIGNTSTDAASRPAELVTEGRSTCTGGTNYRSSLWMPALHRADGEVVVPRFVSVYYKTFLDANLGEGAYELLQVVPQGLSLLATDATTNGGHGLRWGLHDDGRELSVSIRFPPCVATSDGTRTGQPLLDFRDMPGDLADVVNSHVAYPGGPDRNAVGCPATHPYRYPTPSLNVFWDTDAVGEGYRLSSDGPGADPMSTLHGDYVFGVDDEVNEAILRCTIESRSCGFEGADGGLPERLDAPDGSSPYRWGTLRDDADRTPFGVLPRMR